MTKSFPTTPNTTQQPYFYHIDTSGLPEVKNRGEKFLIAFAEILPLLDRFVCQGQRQVRTLRRQLPGVSSLERFTRCTLLQDKSLTGCL